MIRKLLFILVPVIMFASCVTEKNITGDSSENVTGASWAGKVKIVSVGIPGKSYSGEKDYIDVRFDFIPDDADAVNRYLVKEVSDKNILLFYDNRSDLHKNWIEKWGLKTGNTYRAVRHENILNRAGNRTAFEVFLEPR